MQHHQFRKELKCRALHLFELRMLRGNREAALQPWRLGADSRDGGPTSTGPGACLPLPATPWLQAVTASGSRHTQCCRKTAPACPGLHRTALRACMSGIPVARHSMQGLAAELHATAYHVNPKQESDLGQEASPSFHPGYESKFRTELVPGPQPT
jgi:hypothetical protein